MKHAQIAIINPAVSPVIHGMLLIKPARNNAQVLISIPARVLMNIRWEALAVVNILIVVVVVTMNGTEVIVKTHLEVLPVAIWLVVHLTVIRQLFCIPHMFVLFVRIK